MQDDAVGFREGFLHGANGHDALDADSRDCAKGQDSVRLVADDDVSRSCFSAVRSSPSLSQAQRVRPQTGRLL